MMKLLNNYLKDDYNKKTFITTMISACIAFAYAVYNGVLGIAYQSLWNGSTCVYYLFLLIIRGLLLLCEVRTGENDEYSKVMVILSFILLIIMTMAMVTPVVLLIENRRTYDLGLIPAIAMATYTTYSITMAIINMKKASRNDNILIKQARLINMIAALMSLLVLQNTLILATDGYNEDMTILSTCSSIGILVLVLVLIVVSFIKYLKSFINEN